MMSWKKISDKADNLIFGYFIDVKFIKTLTIKDDSNIPYGVFLLR